MLATYDHFDSGHQTLYQLAKEVKNKMKNSTLLSMIAMAYLVKLILNLKVARSFLLAIDFFFPQISFNIE